MNIAVQDIAEVLRQAKPAKDDPAIALSCRLRNYFLLRSRPYHEAHLRTKSVYIHVPKTGGNSVIRMIYGLSPADVGAHTRAQAFLDYSGELYARLFVFATVRHPFARLRSAFHFLKAGGMDEDDRRWSEENLSGFDTFRSFVLALEDASVRSRIVKFLHFIPQSHFICGRDGALIVGHLVRMESFGRDIREVCRVLGIAHTPVYENASGHRIRIPTDEDFGQDLQEICHHIYRRDFDLLGYSRSPR